MRWMIFILVVGLFGEVSAQPNFISAGKRSALQSQKKAELLSQTETAEAEVLFQKIEKGIQNGSVSEFSRFFGNIVYVTLLTRESDYFSPGQAEGILSNFFSTHKSVSFSFSLEKSRSRSFYATGRYMFVEKGKQESVQIYVLLNLRGNKWVITQFNIY
jgi:hypothetical protein